VHDWPDFADVNSRQLEAAILVRHMTGQRVATEPIMKARLLNLMASQNDGLIWRPETSYTHHCADLGDQSLTLCTLNTLYMDEPENRAHLLRMVDRLAEAAVHREGYAFFPGSKIFPGGRWDHEMQAPAGHSELMFIRPLTQIFASTGYEPALVFAGELVKGILEHTGHYSAKGKFPGHVHSHLRALAGFADYGAKTGRADLIELGRKGMEFLRDQGTEFVFIPELTERKDDLVGCETCAVMDYLDLALVLARGGHPEYYELIEKVARNHLVESQLKDLDWLEEDNTQADTDQITGRNLKSRLRGAFAGWSCPCHILAYEEELVWEAWLKDASQKPVYFGKTRALQNCCGGSGPKALYQVWENIARYQEGTLWVHLHIDRDLPQARIRCDKPFTGHLAVTLQAPCAVKIRLPGFVETREVHVTANGRPIPWRQEGWYAALPVQAGETKIGMRYPLPLRSGRISIGNEGYQHYDYKITWKGDTVVEVIPQTELTEGFSSVMGRKVRLYYGAEGPGPLYQREEMIQTDQAPREETAPSRALVSPVRLY